MLSRPDAEVFIYSHDDSGTKWLVNFMMRGFADRFADDAFPFPAGGPLKSLGAFTTEHDFGIGLHVGSKIPSLNNLDAHEIKEIFSDVVHV